MQNSYCRGEYAHEEARHTLYNTYCCTKTCIQRAIRRGSDKKKVDLSWSHGTVSVWILAVVYKYSSIIYTTRGRRVFLVQRNRTQKQVTALFFSYDTRLQRLAIMVYQNIIMILLLCTRYYYNIMSYDMCSRVSHWDPSPGVAWEGCPSKEVYKYR